LVQVRDGDAAPPVDPVATRSGTAGIWHPEAAARPGVPDPQPGAVPRPEDRSQSLRPEGFPGRRPVTAIPKRTATVEIGHVAPIAEWIAGTRTLSVDDQQEAIPVKPPDAAGDPQVQGVVATPELRGSPSDRTTPPLSPLPAQAIAERVRSLSDRLGDIQVASIEAGDGKLRTELELAPKELGRLKMVLQATERGLHLQIVAERPETLDLVRRQIDHLQRALGAEGVTLSGLDLQDHGGDGPRPRADGRGGTPQPPPVGSDAPPAPLGSPATREARTAHGGPLDLRL
jgi:hypothetical protein